MKDMYIEQMDESININQLIKTLNTYEDDIIYLGGSLMERKMCDIAEGMGNKKSDVDIFIIRNHEDFIKTNKYEYLEGFRKTDFYKFNKLNLDLEIFDKEQISDLLKKINDISFSENKRVLNLLQLDNGWSLESVNSFLTRLMYGFPIQNEIEFLNIQKSVNNKKFQKLYVLFLMNVIDNMMMDVVGNYECAQYETALYCARNAFLFYLKIIIYKEKRYVDRDKWVVLKFNNLAKVDIKYKETICFYQELFLSDLKNKSKMKETIYRSIVYINDKIEDLMLEEEN